MGSKAKGSLCWQVDQGMKLFSIVEVDWLDACAYDDRVKKEFIGELHPVKTVGYITFADKEKINVCGDRYGDDKIDRVIVIPKGSIKKIRSVRRGVHK